MPRRRGRLREAVQVDISKKTDYALMMISALVKRPGSVLSVRSISVDDGIPYSFARSIQHDLVNAGIIESIRGSHGGMRLAVDPDKTTLLEVVEAIQGPVSISPCDEAQSACERVCPSAKTCTFNPLWEGARRLLVDYFSSVTLAEAVMGTKPCHSELASS